MIILASDHAGFELKEGIKKFFNDENIITIDVGTYSKEPVDYPDFAKKGCVKILEDSRNVGIFVCGTGLGMSIAVNRNPKIRGALCTDVETATLSRTHNNANVLILPGRSIKLKKAIKIIKTFLISEFEGGRHSRRLKKI